MLVIAVNGRQYVVYPPTIRKMTGGIMHLSEVGMKDRPTVKETLQSITESFDLCAKALSWFIKGDESLYDELSDGKPEEILSGLETAISLISPEVFLKAVSLAKNVASLAAKPMSSETTPC